jgi:hypothetical protein
MIQGNDSFRLVVRRGPQPNQAYDLNKDLVTLGRDITNDIVINDPEVSRHHLRLARGAGGFTLEDLGSTNGTFINGQRLAGSRPLRPGDMIGLGETVTLSYESTVGDASRMAGPPAGTMLNEAQRSMSQPAQPAPMTQQQPIPQQPPPSQYAAVQPSSPYAPPQGYPPPNPQQPAPAPMPSQPVQPGASQPYTYGQQNAPYPSTGYTGAQPSSPYGGPSQSMPAQVPPGTGYGDYDPYAVREETQNTTTRYVLIGCGLISVLCCCATVVGAVAVDQLCLWDRLPIIYPLLNALGYVSICP